MQKRNKLTRLRKRRSRYSTPVARIRGNLLSFNLAAESVLKRYAVLWKSKIDGKLFIEFTDDWNADYTYTVTKTPRDFRITSTLLRGMDGRYYLKYNEEYQLYELVPIEEGGELSG